MFEHAGVFRYRELHVAGREGAFRHMGQMVFQMHPAKRQDAVPLARDYITEFERANASRAIAACQSRLAPANRLSSSTQIHK